MFALFVNVKFTINPCFYKTTEGVRILLIKSDLQLVYIYLFSNFMRMSASLHGMETLDRETLRGDLCKALQP